MRIFYTSDIHTEFGSFPSLPKCDIIVLAGDIGAFEDKSKLVTYLIYASQQAQHVVYVLGNHEYYGTSIHKGVSEIRQIINSHTAAGSDTMRNIHLLDCNKLTLNVGGKEPAEQKNINFYGCTLWTLIKDKETAQNSMSDYEQIKGESSSPLDADYINSVHTAHRSWLEENLPTNDNGEIDIVVTHHMPHQPENYIPKNYDLADAYWTDLSSLMETYKIDYWIYGHTHKKSEMQIGKTMCVSNPHGYPNQLNSYNQKAFLELTF